MIIFEYNNFKVPSFMKFKMKSEGKGKGEGKSEGKGKGEGKGEGKGNANSHTVHTDPNTGKHTVHVDPNTGKHTIYTLNEMGKGKTNTTNNPLGPKNFQVGDDTTGSKFTSEMHGDLKGGIKSNNVDNMAFNASKYGNKSNSILSQLNGNGSSGQGNVINNAPKQYDRINMLRAGNEINGILGEDDTNMSYNYAQMYQDMLDKGMTPAQAKAAIVNDAGNILGGIISGASALQAGGLMAQGIRGALNIGKYGADKATQQAAWNVINNQLQNQIMQNVAGAATVAMANKGINEVSNKLANKSEKGEVSVGSNDDSNAPTVAMPTNNVNKGNDNTNNIGKSNPTTETNDSGTVGGIVANDGSGGRASAFSNNDGSGKGSILGLSSGVSNNSSTVDNGSLAPSGSGSLQAPNRDRDSLGFSTYNQDEANYNDKWNRGQEVQSSGLVSDEECKHFARRAFSEGPHFKKARVKIIEALG